MRFWLALTSGVVMLMAIAARPALADNPIQTENALPGDSHWMAALQDPPSGTVHIEGYADATSVRPGGTISFHVSTNPVARYRIEISRLGWYGGAGGRRIVCLVGSILDPSCSTDHLGVQQNADPAPDPVTGEIRADWSTTDELDVPTNWTSGYYVAVFVLTSGPAAGQTGFTPFIVQAPVGNHSAILVQVPTNTWEAYNAWGGEDLYTDPRAVKVSFDRPFDHRLLFYWEYPLVRFLERGGWDVSYATDNDVDADPSILLDHQLDMTAGHGEYWTKTMRDGWEAARAAGVNLAFMGANTGYWQVRYEDGGRTMVSYKLSPDPDPDPAEQTTQFRLLTAPRPECELMGVQYQGTILHQGQYLDYTGDPAIANDSWFGGTGLAPGTVLPGLVGYETDAITPGCHVPPVTPLLSYSGAAASPYQSDAVRYTACSGAEVFSSGSLQFSWGLDAWRDPSYSSSLLPDPPQADPALQAAMTRALQDLTQSHVPKPGPPEICVPTPDFTESAHWATAGQRVTFTSTATDDYGEIGSQTWSFTEGRRIQTATGQTVTMAFKRRGVVHVRLLASDTSGASAADVKTIRVCPTAPMARPGIAWPVEAQTGDDCKLTPIGTLRWRQHRLKLVPNAGLSNVTIRMYRIKVGTARIRLIPIAAASIVQAGAPFTVRAPRVPTVIDVSAQAAGLTVRQQFLVPASGGPSRPVAQLIGLACDGTSATILTPGFRGRREQPLRVRVRGPGRLTVIVTSADGKTVFRRSVKSRGKSMIISFAAHAFRAGVYRVTVSAQRSALHEPLVLSALSL